MTVTTTIVSSGTAKFDGKSISGEPADGRTRKLGPDVLVVPEEVPIEGVVVVVPPVDGKLEVNSCEIVPFGYTNTTVN
jgi:hypothetical protein